MNLTEKINAIKTEVESASLQSGEQVEQFRLEFLSKKGKISDLFEEFKTVSSDEKRTLGSVLNQLKVAATEKWQNGANEHQAQQTAKTAHSDLTTPGFPVETGSTHPLSLVRNEIFSIFQKLGFSISDGPEIESDWYNFSALNFPPDHPARDMQDTFFVDSDENAMALRTHTSSVQIRVMENNQPPIRTISPGRVYRNEAISARAHCFFHQVEALYVDKGVSFADLKQTLLHFSKEMFGSDTKIRLRPSYFPFTEPSAEMDISCTVCGGKGCAVCKHSGWVEILGCGMVDPQVLSNCGIDSDKYTGFALGMGIERITMLKYQIKDLRFFSQNDLRFLKQFEGRI